MKFSLSHRLLFLIILGGLFACSDPSPTPIPTPTTLLNREQGPQRPFITVQFCSDDTSSYPREDFNNANALIANSLIQAVRANEAGLKLYATIIAHNTFDPLNTLDPPFTIPAIPSYPSPPPLTPTPTPFNIVTDRATKIAVVTNNNKRVADYNAQVLSIDKSVQNQINATTQDVNRLKTWNPPIDDVATSIFGCFELAQSRFQGQTGTKLLYIASDFENNTDIDYTKELVTSHELSGVVIHAIFYYSENAVHAQEKINQWCPFLKAAGAKAVIFDDPSKSLSISNTDLFSEDATPSHSC